MNQLQSVESLDKQLRVIESNFEKKLSKYFDSFEKSILSQVTRFRDNEKDLTLPRDKLIGLERLYKEHFKSIEKISAQYTKNELIALAPNDKQSIMKLKTDRINEYNLKYAKELATKQYYDYLEKANKTLREAIKLNKNESTKQLKDLVKQANQTFKNQRVQVTSQTESNRVMNETRVLLADKMKRFRYKFIVVLDERTTKEICLPRQGLVFTKETLQRYRKQLLPCLHPYCRSQLIPTVEKATSLDRVIAIIRKYPSLR